MLSVQDTEVARGDVLVGQNLLITSALLLENNNRPAKEQISLDAGNLQDFCTLVNAIVAQNRLLTLPAEMPSEVKNSRLYRYLESKGILRELRPSFDKFNVNEKEEIMDLSGLKSEDEAATILLSNI
jgi:hypothetical protein